MRDYHRIAIVDTTTKSIIKDRLSILAQNPGVQATGDIAVKDLGAPSLLSYNAHRN